MPSYLTHTPIEKNEFKRFINPKTWHYVFSSQSALWSGLRFIPVAAFPISPPGICLLGTLGKATVNPAIAVKR